MTDFDSADYYDCRDSEVLTHSDPEEAIEEWLDGLLSPGCDTAAVIAEHAPVTVRALVHEKVSERDVETIASSLVEHAAEFFGENYGDPDGGDNGIDSKVEEEVLPLFVEAVKKLYAHATVWACREVAVREYSAEEVEAMMRKYNPEWFDEQATGV